MRAALAAVAALAALAVLAVLAVLAGEVLAPSCATAQEAPTPREHYLLHCSGCHGADGRGAAGVTPTLHGLVRFLEIPGGREYVARVPGVAQAPLDDEQLAALLNWILTEFSPGRPSDAGYRAPELHRLRATALRDPLVTRAALVSSSN